MCSVLARVMGFLAIKMVMGQKAGKTLLNQVLGRQAGPSGILDPELNLGIVGR